MNKSDLVNVSVTVYDEVSTFNNNAHFSVLDISDLDTDKRSFSNMSISISDDERRNLKFFNKSPAKQNNDSLPETMPLEDASSIIENDPLSIIVEEGTHIVNDDIDADDTLEKTNNKVSNPTGAEYSKEYINGEEEKNHAASLLHTSDEQDTSFVETDIFSNTLVELGRRLWISNTNVQQYTKGCLWSPDGTCLLLSVHMDGMHVIELPLDLYNANEVSAERTLSTLKSAVHIKEGGTIYDSAWYPFMNSTQPETCFWIATRQHEPIHMWDAFDGHLRCSYSGYDDVDEVETAISIMFSNNGEKIIGGYKKSIKVFDVHRPGRECSLLKVKQAVSCFAQTTESVHTITSGSWNGYINHYDLRSPKLGPLFTLGGHHGGITYLRYAAETCYLFSGARKDNQLLKWDMRNYKQPVRQFQRTVKTNQRIYFDLSPQQNWLASGSTNGNLHLWSLINENVTLEIPLHNDCCNGVNFHPKHPILATSSGQYHFMDSKSPIPAEDDATKPLKFIDYENSLLLLWIGKTLK